MVGNNTYKPWMKHGVFLSPRGVFARYLFYEKSFDDRNYWGLNQTPGFSFNSCFLFLLFNLNQKIQMKP